MRGYFVAFDSIQDAISEIVKRTGKSIIALTVRDILQREVGAQVGVRVRLGHNSIGAMTMSRQYCFMYCAVILLFCSNHLLAQGEPRDAGGADPNEAVSAVDPNEVTAVMKSYMEAIDQGKYAEVVALSYFRNDEERQGFQKILSRHGMVMAYDPALVQRRDLTEEVHLVRVRRKGDAIKAMFLMPTKEGYVFNPVSMREVEGQLKIVPKDVNLDKLLDGVGASIARMREELEGWQTARGAALSEKCLEVKENLKTSIAAHEYAEAKELRLHHGHGDLTGVLKIYEELRNLSDEELQAKMIRDAQQFLEGHERPSR